MPRRTAEKLASFRVVFRASVSGSTVYDLDLITPDPAKLTRQLLARLRRDIRAGRVSIVCNVEAL